MAYYEMMPAGLPSGLQSGMDSVLNKKFGTSTSYAPGTWPDTVNLMGPLPEATVSGAIATLEDGADAVPCKNVVATIAPNLAGVSIVTVTKTGKNLCNVAPWVRDTTFYGSNWTEMVAFLNTLPAGNYSVSYDYEITALLGSSIDVAYSPYIRALINGSYVNVTPYSAPQTDSSPTVGKIYHCSASFSLTSQTVGNIANFYLYCGQSGIKVAEVTVKNAMVELGSTVSTYEPYTPTTYTAQLGRTVYGGTADVVNGEGQELVKKITVSSFSGTWGAVTNGYAYYISDADTTHSTSVVNPIMMQANQLFTYGSVERNSAPTWQYGGNDGGTTVHTFILPSEYDTLTKANNFLASLQTPLEVTLTLATPTDFSFTGQEIPTMLGYNAFWSDSGDTEVTYRADINLALQALSGSRGLMMARPQLEPETEPEETIEETPEEMER